MQKFWKRTISIALALLLWVSSANVAFAQSTKATTDNQAITLGASFRDTKRTLYADDFESNDGSGWEVTSSSVCTFSDGKAHIKGAGAENRIALKNKIMADNFNVSVDLLVGSENTNSNIKFGIKAAEGYTSRYQVRFDTVNSRLYIDAPGGDNSNALAQTSCSMPASSGPYGVSITVQDDDIIVYINDSHVLTATDTGISLVPMGYFLVASQFPKQDFSIDNLLITSSDPAVGEKYELTLKTTTNGAEDTFGSEIGGTLGADIMEGYEGDLVKLSPTVNAGYIFKEYTSLITETGNSTDGLLDINNNQFRFNSKTGSVTVFAHYITKPVDPNILFKDDFGDTLNSHGLYHTIADAAGAEIDNEALVLASISTPNYLLVDGSAWISEANGQGYTIELDISKTNNTAGTTQIAFRANGFSQRYVLALNGEVALIRRFDSGVNNELARANYVFDQTTRRISISVLGDTVVVRSNGEEILSYTNTNSSKDNSGWSDVSAGLGLINMTSGAPVIIDNILVTRQLPAVKINVKVSKNGEDDPEFTSGTIAVNPTTAAVGETITIVSTAKAGYKLEGYLAEGITFTGNTFVIPVTAIGEEITITANFVDDTLREAKTFYIDSQLGNDSNSGDSEAAPWKTLKKINPDSNTHVPLVPGDSVLFKNGSVFSGADSALRFAGSGSEGNQITLSTYGTGGRPRFEGLGQVENIVQLFNQEYITIDGLEITNLHPDYSGSFDRNASNNRSKTLRGVNVFGKDYGVLSSIHLNDLYIHDINGSISLKWNGGIFFDIQADIQGGQLQGTPTKYHDIRIENCKIERVDRSAIKLVSSSWCNQSLANSPSVPLNWYPSTGVVVRGNNIRQVGGDGITVRDTENALIEYNLAANCRYQDTGYNAGIWTFETVGTVVQYNEAYLTRGVQDGQGFDCDHVSSYTVMQYNYSHDNEGGFMLIMNGFPHTGPTVRYNISQNDKDKTFEFSRGTPNGTMIYNNTLYSNAVLSGRKGVFDLANSGAGTGNRQFYVFNNIFHYPENQQFYCGEIANLKSNIQIYNNAYYGGIIPPDEEEKPITTNPMLNSIGSGPSSNNSSTPTTGKYLSNQLDGYQLLAGSPLINAGVTVDEILTKYGGTATDRRTLSPVEIHDLAKAGRSIDFAAGAFFPEISEVDYGLDFFGGDMISGGSPDIGAMEIQASAPDTTLPQVLSLSPSGSAVSLGENRLSITFNEAMNITAEGIVSLSPSGATLSPATPYWSDNGQVVNYNLSNLSYDTTYSISISGFADLTGNIMDPINSGFSFTTERENPAVSSVSVSPKTVTLEKGDSQQFAADVSVIGGASTAVVWTVAGATSSTISTTGQLMVGIDESSSTFTVTATSAADSLKHDSATITIDNSTVPIIPEVISVSISPKTALLEKGGSQQFTTDVIVIGGASTAVVWTVAGATSSTISATGQLMVGADESSTILTVTATSAIDSSKHDSATISIEDSTLPIVPEVISVSISPKTALLEKGGSQQFTADVSVIGGASTAVVWTVAGATSSTISATGQLMVGADESSTILTVTATSSSDSSKHSVSTVTITTKDVPTNPVVPKDPPPSIVENQSNSAVPSRNTIDKAVYNGSNSKTVEPATVLSNNPALLHTSGSSAYGISDEILKSIAGTKRYRHDTIVNGAVQVRLDIYDTSTIQEGVYVSGYTQGASTDKLKTLFGKYFDNPLQTLSLDESKPWNSEVKIAAKMDLSGMNTENLYFYSYDKETNKYHPIVNPKYKIDANGYLHFYTTFAGGIIISDGALRKNTH